MNNVGEYASRGCDCCDAVAAGSITWHVHPIAGLAVRINKNVQLAIVIGCGEGNAVKSDIESTSHEREPAAEAQKNKRGTLEKANLAQSCKIGFWIFARCTCHLWQGTRGVLKTFPLQEKPAANWDIGQWCASRVDCLADLQKRNHCLGGLVTRLSDFGPLSFLFALCA